MNEAESLCVTMAEIHDDEVYIWMRVDFDDM
eukprot:CAMPEP_0182448818 /NCGR_PEP_ID=MMETSP1172-20130603/30072_1 /TAXON_ID=708627 /ORGANISM="Timspurckia oligopyrenoides, Strain CCMP3278" /LENGTH=30 /DNA_ID= /DNA_START= /DNA_END= /DNA_ORIENTATION=